MPAAAAAAAARPAPRGRCPRGCSQALRGALGRGRRRLSSPSPAPGLASQRLNSQTSIMAAASERRELSAAASRRPSAYPAAVHKESRHITVRRPARPLRRLAGRVPGASEAGGEAGGGRREGGGRRTGGGAERAGAERRRERGGERRGACPVWPRFAPGAAPASASAQGDPAKVGQAVAELRVRRARSLTAHRWIGLADRVGQCSRSLGGRIILPASVPGFLRNGFHSLPCAVVRLQCFARIRR